MTDVRDVRERALGPAQRERLRERSKVLFGNRDRLEVAVMVARSEDKLVNATDLSWSVGLAPNRVRAQLLALVQVGLLEEAPMAGEGGRRVFVRVDHPFWDVCLRFLESWAD